MGVLVLAWQFQVLVLLTILPMVAGVGLGVVVSHWLGVL